MRKRVLKATLWDNSYTRKLTDTISKINKGVINAIFYIFCYTLASLYYPNNMGVPIEKKPDPGDQEFNFKFCSSIGFLGDVTTPL